MLDNNPSVLLTNAYYYRLDPKQWKTHKPFPPLGTLWAAAVMREAGIQVGFFDSNLVESPNDFLAYADNHPSPYVVIYDDGFNFLTKMCLTNMRNAVFRIIRKLSQKGFTVLIASSDSTDHYMDYLDQGAAYVLLGEAEITLKELILNLESGNMDSSKIDGLAYRNGDGKLIMTSKRQISKDLDAIPIPAWDLLDIEPYKQEWDKKGSGFMLNIATTRGCPFKCNWCAKPIYGNRYNSRSPENVLQEISYLMDRFDVGRFWFCDDIFGLKPGWVQEFNQLAKEKSLEFQYKIQTRVDLLLKEDTIDAMAESGLYEAWVGAESGSQRILDAMDKGTTVEQIRESTSMLKEKGIRIGFFIQLGYLGETKEDINQTVRLIDELKPDDIGVSISYPLPGTGFYEKVKTGMDRKVNWEDSDDLDLMYKGNFSSAYYKKTHRYLHRKFRFNQGIGSVKKVFLGQIKPWEAEWRKIALIFYNFPLTIWHALNLKLMRQAA